MRTAIRDIPTALALRSNKRFFGTGENGNINQNLHLILIFILSVQVELMIALNDNGGGGTKNVMMRDLYEDIAGRIPDRSSTKRGQEPE